jgi:hypothetical protein
VDPVGASESSDPVQATRATRLTGRDAVKLHLTLAGGLALCIAAFYFELLRALGGNSLSWAYVFEWPILAVFAVYMWWTMLHQNRRSRRRPKAPTVAPEHVQMLKAWQEHLKAMADTEREIQRAKPESGSAP